jgi:DNA-binding MarR family transcriptional regulator
VPYLTERELLAWRGLIEIEARLLPIFDDALRRTLGMTINEFDVLYHLWIAPNQRCRMTELSRSVVVTPSGVTRIVTRLEERQLVLRAGRKGRQAVDAALTPLGERTLRHAMEIHFANVRMRFIDRLRSVDVDWLIELRRRFY